MTALKTPTALEYDAMLQNLVGSPKEISESVASIRMDIHGAYAHGQITLNEWLALMQTSGRMQIRREQ